MSTPPRSAELHVAVEEPGARCAYDDVVVGRITQGDPVSFRAAGAAIRTSSAEIVCVQHEFGLFGVRRDGRSTTISSRSARSFTVPP